MGNYASRFGVPYNLYCWSCEEDRETFRYLRCHCPTLARLRKLGKSFFEDLNDMLSFVNATGYMAQNSVVNVQVSRKIMSGAEALKSYAPHKCLCSHMCIKLALLDDNAKWWWLSYSIKMFLESYYIIY